MHAFMGLRLVRSAAPPVERTSAVLSAPMPEPVAVAEPTRAETLVTDMRTDRAERVAIGLALSIPSVRKAVHVIAGTIGTLSLAAWEGDTRLTDDDTRWSWLRQPDPTRTRQAVMTRTVSDLIWHDRAVWRITDRTLYGTPTAAERVHPARIDTISHPMDPDQVQTWIIDGADTPARNLIVFDGAGLGGLQRYGWDLLTLYGQLQTAAGRYAKTPHPYAILKNHGADLDDDEIDALLASWETARGTRGIGYLNDVVDYEPVAGSWSAEDLQLTEAREHAALEVARLFGLPAASLDAAVKGSSLTYANVTDRRRDEARHLRPWMDVITGTLSMNDRRGRTSGICVPRGVHVTFDLDDFLRDTPGDRMTAWETGLRSGVLTLDEARAAEPLARSTT